MRVRGGGAEGDRPVRPPSDAVETPLARVGRVEVSRFETATGPRLRLREAAPGRDAREAYLDPLELEGLTRVRYKPIRVLPAAPGRAAREHQGRGAPPEQAGADADRGPAADAAGRLQNEFALVAVAAARTDGEAALLITDLNAGHSVLLSGDELEALLQARHMDFAPLIDTSDLVALPEPDIDQV